MRILKNFLFIGLMIFMAFTVSACASTISSPDLDLIDLMHANQIRLIVMRHGEAIHNLSHQMNSGRSPVIYLTEKGAAKVQETADQLINENIGAVYVSPVYRTLQTAQIIGMKLEIPYQKMSVEEKLREQFFGDFEGLTYDEYEAYFTSPEELFTARAPNGESGNELFIRTRDLLWEIASKHAKETVLIITHAFNCCQISRCFMGSYFYIPELAEYRSYDFSSECIIVD